MTAHELCTTIYELRAELIDACAEIAQLKQDVENITESLTSECHKLDKEVARLTEENTGLERCVCRLTEEKVEAILRKDAEIARKDAEIARLTGDIKTMQFMADYVSFTPTELQKEIAEKDVEIDYTLRAILQQETRHNNASLREYATLRAMAIEATFACTATCAASDTCPGRGGLSYDECLAHYIAHFTPREK